MYLTVAHPPVDFDRYRPLIPPQLANDLTALAQELRHLRFVHINSTATGGGVSEILQSMVPLMNALGIATERVVIEPPPRFFQATKHIHNLLQGAQGGLSSEESKVYFQSIRDVARDIRRHRLEADVWFLHDPQLLPLAHLLPRDPDSAWFWVAHIDLTAPNQGVLESLLPLAGNYDGLVFSLDAYVPNQLNGRPPVCIATPAIDPLSVKNTPLEEPEALEIVAAMGVDPARPLVTQVSRFDHWKDPWGVIDAYRLARQAFPDLQLALLGLSQAADDPESQEVLASVTEYAAQDPDIHLYSCVDGLPSSIDMVVNAFQVASQVVVQKSTREGFGLTVTEAMWKGKAVVGGNVGGIRLQIEDGVSGYLVDTSEECARRIIQLMRSPGLRARMGEKARETVRQEFLLPRLALDYLRLAKASAPGPNGSNGDGARPFHELEELRAAVPSLPPNGNGNGGRRPRRKVTPRAPLGESRPD
jgi:trehalose synthase